MGAFDCYIEAEDEEAEAAEVYKTDDDGTELLSVQVTSPSTRYSPHPTPKASQPTHYTPTPPQPTPGTPHLITPYFNDRMI